MRRTRTTVRPRHPVAALAAAVLAAAAGCGGAEEPRAPAKAALTAKPAAPNVRTPSGGLAAGQATGRPSTPASAISDVPASPEPRTFRVSPIAQLERETLARLRTLRAQAQRHRLQTAKEHADAALAAVRGITNAVLVEAGLRRMSFKVTGDGRIVSIGIPRTLACTLTPTEPAQIAQRIDGASQIVDKVIVRVQGSKIEPAAYIRRHCERPAPLPGAGKVVFRAVRSGIVETPVFRVRSPRWTIQYDNSSAILQVYLYKGGKLLTLPVNVKSRGAGKQIVDGAGTYTLRIASTGRWSVRVRDGA